MKKILTTLVLAFSAMTMMADEFKIGKLIFEITSSTEVSLKSADQDITKAFLSETIDYQGKTYTLTEIDHYAFGWNSSLTWATIPNSVKSIKHGAFEGTELYKDPANWENGALYISDCLIEVDTNFVGNLKIKENTRLIGGGAFTDCKSLTSVTIPKSVTSINCGFFRCSALASIVIDSENPVYDSRNNCNAIIETATNTLFAGCQSTIIPNSVTSIGNWAFKCCSSLTSITIPNSVKSIGEEAFSGCSSLTSVTIPNGVKSIGDEAFELCTSLISVTIPRSVTHIGNGAFGDCSSLASTTIPNSVTSIGVYAFWGTAFYQNPANWKNGALYIDNCLLKVDTNFVGNFKIKENTRLIGDAAFHNCKSLTSVTIPNSVTSIGDCVFGRCSALASIVIDSENPVYDSRNNCNAIIETATNTLIAGCKNTIIPNSITSIGEAAFWQHSSLTSITIPNSVTSIGNWAFEGCSALTSVTIPNSVKEIREGAFCWCTSLRYITIPNSVTNIGEQAFWYCSALTSITIPNSVKEVGIEAFYKCSAITSITIPNSVTEIGEAAFCGCTSLRYITIPKRLEPRGRDLFCDSFDSATIHCTETDSNNNNNSNSKGKTEEEPLIIRNVQLQEDGETYSVPAVEGQLVLMFDEDMSHEESLDILEGKGLSVISSIPELNYYLIQVPVGEEGQYFSQLNDNDLVDYVYPNTIEYFCSANAYALDDYNYGDHGRKVSEMLTGCDPLMNLIEMNVALTDSTCDMYKVNKYLNVVLLPLLNPFNKSNNKVVINLSFGPGLKNKHGRKKRVLWNDADVTEDNRKSNRKSYIYDLKKLIKLAKRYDEAEFVIVKSTGNNGMKQLETIIDELTSELTWDELQVFERHFLLVSAKDDYTPADYPNDVSRYHKMVSKVDISDMTKQDPNWAGTSFSSPRLAGYIYKLAEEYDLPATIVLGFVRSATERAIDNVVTYELIEEEITSYYRVVVDFVDLGLPSGTLWKAESEAGLYTYREANDWFVRETEHLPTYDQLIELKQQCKWEKTDTGYEVVGPNGNSITFSADGYFDCAGYPHYINGGAGIFGNETIGMIWSSTPTDADKAYSMGIGTYNAGIIQADECCYGRSVHLVENDNTNQEIELADDLIGQIIYDPSENSYFPEDWSWTLQQGEVLGVDVLARDVLQDSQNIRVLTHLHRDAIKIDAELTMHYVKSGNGYILQSTAVNKLIIPSQTDYSQYVKLEMDYDFLPMLMLHNNSNMTLFVGGDWLSNSGPERFGCILAPNASKTIAIGNITSYHIHFAYRK